MGLILLLRSLLDTITSPPEPRSPLSQTFAGANDPVVPLVKSTTVPKKTTLSSPAPLAPGVTV